MKYEKNHVRTLKFDYCRGENAVHKQNPNGSEKQVRRLGNISVHLVKTRRRFSINVKNTKSKFVYHREETAV